MNSILRIGGLLMCLFVVVASGCSTYKEDFEKAKGTISDLESKNRSLTEQVKALKKEIAGLQDKSEKLGKENADLTAQTSRLQKDNLAGSEKLAEMKKQCAEFKKTLNDLKKVKEELTRKNKDLEERIAAFTRAGTPTSQAIKPGEVKLGGDKAVPVPKAALSPCDAVLEYMRKCEAIVRASSGSERTERLAALKSAYTDKMRGAPAKAVSEAEAWVAEIIRYVDKPKDDSVFLILTRRDAVLKACGKTAKGAGF